MVFIRWQMEITVICSYQEITSQDEDTHKERREITAKLKDTLRESILRKNTDTQTCQREKADSKMVGSLKRRKGDRD